MRVKLGQRPDDLFISVRLTISLFMFSKMNCTLWSVAAELCAQT